MTEPLYLLAVVQPRTYIRRWCKHYTFDTNAPPEEQNLTDATQYITEAASSGAGYVAFPELYPGPMDADSPFTLGEVTESIAKQARNNKVWVLFGGTESTTNGKYNTYSVVSPQGYLAGRYRKIIPGYGEDSLPGNIPTVVDADGLQLGLALCWEAWFPEISRILTLMGADVIFFPTGGLVYELNKRWRQVLATRAAENIVYTVASVNLLAMEDGLCVINSPEKLVAESIEVGVTYAIVDKARLTYLRSKDEEVVLPKKYHSIPGLIRALRPEIHEMLYQVVCNKREN